MNRIRLFLVSYSFILVLFFLYSFTQVDLGLTLTRVSVWQEFQRSFQYIGYFNRPLSTLFYILLLGALFAFYLGFLILIQKNKIKRNTLWKIIIFASILFSFCYAAFSYDLFNYIFDAKIFTYYHQNPYLHKALDYPGEPMLSFMHWTHRTYPYGPIWLGATIPLSYLGLNYFLPTYFIFKIFLSLSFVASCFLIEKIARKINLNSNFSLAFFALNPVVLIECLISSHNDILMMVLALAGVYLLFSNRKFFALGLIVISALVKDVTAVLLAPFILYSLNIKRIKIPQNFILSCVFFLTLGFIFVVTRMEVQSWYFLWILPFIVLLKPNWFLVSVTTGLSLGLLLPYSLFLYQGNWDGAFPHKVILIIVSTFIFPVITYLILRASKKLNFFV